MVIAIVTSRFSPVLELLFFICFKKNQVWLLLAVFHHKYATTVQLISQDLIHLKHLRVIHTSIIKSGEKRYIFLFFLDRIASFCNIYTSKPIILICTVAQILGVNVCVKNCAKYYISFIQGLCWNIFWTTCKYLNFTANRRLQSFFIRSPNKQKLYSNKQAQGIMNPYNWGRPVTQQEWGDRYFEWSAEMPAEHIFSCSVIAS